MKNYNTKLIVLISFILISNLITYSYCNNIKNNNTKNNLKQPSITVDLIMHFPYTCGTWFNRGKNTCQFIKEELQNNGFKVYTTVKPHSVSEQDKDYDGFFNIYLNKNGNLVLLATSNEEKQDYFHKGLKYFAYNFYQNDPKTGQRNWMDNYPHKDDLLKFMLKRTIEEIKSKQ